PWAAASSFVNSWPMSWTVPPVGASSPPSRCSKVLFPEPEAPTMATVSPAWTCRSTPRNTSTSRPPSLKRLVRPSALRTTSPLFITQRLGGVDAAGAPARIDRGHERQRQRDQGDRHDVFPLRVAGHLADQVDVL